jgi:hypothetical protein
LKGEQLFIGETLHLHPHFSPRVDARAQMLLDFCYGGKSFVAGLALFNSIWFLVGSESGNCMSVENNLSAPSYHAFFFLQI